MAFITEKQPKTTLNLIKKTTLNFKLIKHNRII